MTGYYSMPVQQYCNSDISLIQCLIKPVVFNTGPGTFCASLLFGTRCISYNHKCPVKWILQVILALKVRFQFEGSVAACTMLYLKATEQHREEENINISH